jgi:cytochrome bd-type quinol oxidase subunit 2
MLLDRLISSVIAALGILSILASVLQILDETTSRSLLGIGTLLVGYALIGYRRPQTNDELRSRFAAFARYATLVLIGFAAVVLSIYLVVGETSEELFMIAITLGLPSALLIPVLAKQLVAKRPNTP